MTLDEDLLGAVKVVETSSRAAVPSECRLWSRAAAASQKRRARRGSARSEVAAGIFTSAAGERVALGMLPTGTANEQGMSFGLEATRTRASEMSP